jgi:ribosomal protein S18 acetylase RimI-like enzyme
MRTASFEGHLSLPGSPRKFGSHQRERRTEIDIEHMTTRIREASSDRDWEQATALLQRVYVGGGFTAAATAAQFMTRANLEPAGMLLVAVGPAEEVMGTVLLLHPESPLKQLAVAGEREFRMLGVGERTRGSGIGANLVEACVTRAFTEGAQTVVLWTQPRMHSAQRLYARLGFQRAPERDHEDARGFTRLVYRRIR